jgi:MFS family permease
MAHVTELEPTGASTVPPSSQEDPPTQLLLLATAGLSAGAAGIHFAVVPGHLAEDLLAGYFFIAVAIAQTLWAILISRYPRRRLLLIGALGNLLVAVVWLVVRVYGSPLGEHPWTPEPVGLADAMSAAFEVAAGTTVWVLCSRLRPRVRRVAGPALAVGVILVLLTGAALLNVGMVQ